MAYELKVADSVVYELLLSFLLYKRRANLKYLAKRTDWIQEMDGRLPKAFKEKVDAFEEMALGDALCVLIGDAHVDTFLVWLRSLSATQMYQYLAPHLRERDSGILLGLEKQRDDTAYFLEGWQKHYFQFERVEDELARGMEAVESALTARVDPVEIVEHFATGLRIEMEGIRVVHLIPSVHFAPLHTFSILKQSLFVWYPLQTALSELDNLVNVGKCLSDRTRMEILRLLATPGNHTFTDVVRAIGGAIGNAHHHLMTLRSAGLVSITLVSEGQTFFRTRKAFVPELKAMLEQFLE